MENEILSITNRHTNTTYDVPNRRCGGQLESPAYAMIGLAKSLDALKTPQGATVERYVTAQTPAGHKLISDLRLPRPT